MSVFGRLVWFSVMKWEIGIYKNKLNFEVVAKTIAETTITKQQQKVRRQRVVIEQRVLCISKVISSWTKCSV